MQLTINKPENLRKCTNKNGYFSCASFFQFFSFTPTPKRFAAFFILLKAVLPGTKLYFLFLINVPALHIVCQLINS